MNGDSPFGQWQPPYPLYGIPPGGYENSGELDMTSDVERTMIPHQISLKLLALIGPIFIDSPARELEQRKTLANSEPTLERYDSENSWAWVATQPIRRWEDALIRKLLSLIRLNPLLFRVGQRHIARARTSTSPPSHVTVRSQPIRLGVLEKINCCELVLDRFSMDEVKIGQRKKVGLIGEIPFLWWTSNL